MIALVGAGRIGRLHGRLVASQPDVTVVVSDVDAGRAAEVAAAVGGSTAPTPGAAFGQADAVIIAASTDAHAALVREAVDSWPADILRETAGVRPAPRRSSSSSTSSAPACSVQVGFQRRFDPAYREARRLVESGELGTVYLVRLIAHDHQPPPDAYIPVSGGLFRDSSIHDFDALRWVTGAGGRGGLRDRVGARLSRSSRGYDDVDTGAAILRLADGTLGVLSADAPRPARLRHPDGDRRVAATASPSACRRGRRCARSRRTAPPCPGPAWKTFLTRFEAAYRAELLAFLRVARGRDRQPLHRAGRAPGDAHLGGRRSLARRASARSRWARSEPRRRHLRRRGGDDARRQHGRRCRGAAQSRIRSNITGGGRMKLPKRVALRALLIRRRCVIPATPCAARTRRPHHRRRPGRRGRRPQGAGSHVHRGDRRQDQDRGAPVLGPLHEARQRPSRRTTRPTTWSCSTTRGCRKFGTMDCAARTSVRWASRRIPTSPRSSGTSARGRRRTGRCRRPRWASRRSCSA